MRVNLQAAQDMTSPPSRHRPVQFWEPDVLPVRQQKLAITPLLQENAARSPESAHPVQPFAPFSPAPPRNVGVVILAAGFSSRMSDFKPLMPFQVHGVEQPALEMLLERYQRLGIETLVVVSGHKGQAVDAVTKRAGASSIRNPCPGDGMFSSVRLGLGCLPSACTHVFIHPVDIPLVRLLTLRRLLVVAETQPQAVCLPIFNGKSGHPPLIPVSTDIRRRLCRSRPSDGLRGALDCLPKVRVDVPDRLMLLDMDTRDDYASMRNMAAQADVLSPDEAVLLMRTANVAPEVWAHCQAVGTVARAMALALCQAGFVCDPDKACSGGLTHDMAKGLPGHDMALGHFFRDNALPGMARMSETHMDLELAEGCPLTEHELVFLADKHVCGTQPVALEVRYLHKLELFASQPDVLSAIQGRLERARKIEQRFIEDSGHSPLQLARAALSHQA